MSGAQATFISVGGHAHQQQPYTVRSEDGMPVHELVDRDREGRPVEAPGDQRRRQGAGCAHEAGLDAEGGRQVGVGVAIDREHPPAAARFDPGQGGRDRRLAGATLAGQRDPHSLDVAAGSTRLSYRSSMVTSNRCTSRSEPTQECKAR
jgi:hypothetical protein